MKSDHIKSVALSARPSARRGVIDSTFFSQPSMLKTIALMLGLPTLGLFDFVATDMRTTVISSTERPDFAP